MSTFVENKFREKNTFKGDKNFFGENDTFKPGLGTDKAYGGGGDDLLILDYSAGDTGTGISLKAGASVRGYFGKAYRYINGSSNYLDYIYFTDIDRFNVIGTSKDDTITIGGWSYGNDRIDGGAGNDTIQTGGGNDTLTGGTGSDILVGGSGNDLLTGSSGADRFTFNDRNVGTDTITDFVRQSDKIAVSAGGFRGGLVAGAAIAVDQFVLGTAATDSSDRFIYNRTNGALFFDPDGTGSSNALQIATLTTRPSLSNTDIVVF